MIPTAAARAGVRHAAGDRDTRLRTLHLPRREAPPFSIRGAGRAVRKRLRIGARPALSGRLWLAGFAFLSGAFAGIPCRAAPRFPFPRHRTYAAGTIRPNHRSQNLQDADAGAYYDLWKAAYVVQAGTTGEGYPLYRVSYGSSDPGRTVSEGQGYGMVIVVHMAGHDSQAQTIFDGLWEFSRAYPSDIDNRLMGWQVPAVPGSNDSAFDGDADIAFALLLADRQWGSEGRINYRAEAATVMAGILESTIGPTSHLPMLGDWVDPNGAKYNEHTPRSSDFMPGHFRTFFRATVDPAWTDAAAASQAVISSIQSNHSPATGLLPDFIVPVSPADPTPQPAPANFLEGPYDGDYYYNAGRDPWRIGADALLNGDPLSLAQCRKITAWAHAATGGVPAAIKAGYRLNGTPLPSSDYFTILFAAPLGVAAMTDPDRQAWLNDIYDAVAAVHEDYYEDSVTLLCLLAMTGNFWDPDHAGLAPVAYLPLVQK